MKEKLGSNLRQLLVDNDSGKQAPKIKQLVLKYLKNFLLFLTFWFSSNSQCQSQRYNEQFWNYVSINDARKLKKYDNK